MEFLMGEETKEPYVLEPLFHRKKNWRPEDIMTCVES